MSIGRAPMCMGCKHLLSGAGTLACDAYPEGIPEAIYNSKAGGDHREPHPGDHGIRFDPKDAGAAAYAEELFPTERRTAEFAYRADEARDFHGRWVKGAGVARKATGAPAPTAPAAEEPAPDGGSTPAHKPKGTMVVEWEQRIEADWDKLGPEKQAEIVRGLGSDGDGCYDYTNCDMVKLVDLNNIREESLARDAAWEGMSIEEYSRQAQDRIRKLMRAAKVVKRTHLSTLTKIVNGDGRFKTQFETDRSSGLYDPMTRIDAERWLFDAGGDEMPMESRPIYGYLTAHPGEEGYTSTSEDLEQYGDVDVVFKGSVKERTTAMVGDSLGQGMMGVGDRAPQPVNHPTLRMYNQANINILKDIKDVDDFVTANPMGEDPYFEAQIHGGVTVQDIDYVVFPADWKNMDPRGGAIPAHAGEDTVIMKTLSDRGIKYKFASTGAPFSMLRSTVNSARDLALFVFNPQEARDFHGQWVKGAGVPRKGPKTPKVKQSAEDFTKPGTAPKANPYAGATPEETAEAQKVIDAAPKEPPPPPKPAPKVSPKMGSGQTKPPEKPMPKYTIPGEVAMGTKIGGQAGSNEGGMWKGTDGTKRYIKKYKEDTQVYGELLANKIYGAMDVAVPYTEVVRVKDGSIRLATQVVGTGGPEEQLQQDGSGLTKPKSMYLLKGFVADVLLGNRDVLGASLDNIINPGLGVLFRIDNGSSLLHRAQGERKPTSELDNIGEWDSLAPGGKNNNYAHVFIAAGYDKPEDIPDIKKQLKAVQDVPGKLGYTDWKGVVNGMVPDMPAHDRALVWHMLKTRAELLDKKLKAMEPAKPKTAAELLVEANPATSDEKDKVAMWDAKAELEKLKTEQGKLIAKYGADKSTFFQQATITEYNKYAELTQKIADMTQSSGTPKSTVNSAAPATEKTTDEMWAAQEKADAKASSAAPAAPTPPHDADDTGALSKFLTKQANALMLYAADMKTLTPDLHDLRTKIHTYAKDVEASVSKGYSGPGYKPMYEYGIELLNKLLDQTTIGDNDLAFGGSELEQMKVLAADKEQGLIGAILQVPQTPAKPAKPAPKGMKPEAIATYKKFAADTQAEYEKMQAKVDYYGTDELAAAEKDVKQAIEQYTVAQVSDPQDLMDSLAKEYNTNVTKDYTQVKGMLDYWKHMMDLVHTVHDIDIPKLGSAAAPALTKDNAVQEAFPDFVDGYGNVIDPGRYDPGGLTFKSYDGHESPIIDSYSRWAGSLNMDEKSAVRAYMGTAYGDLNEWLRRGGDKGDKPFNAARAAKEFDTTRAAATEQEWHDYAEQIDADNYSKGMGYPERIDYPYGKGASGETYDQAIAAWHTEHDADLKAHQETAKQAFMAEEKRLYIERMQDDYENDHPPVDDRIKSMHKNLQSAFNKPTARAPENMLIFRSGKLTKPGKAGIVLDAPDWQKGDILTDLGYSSSTLDLDVADRFSGDLFTIEVPKGSKAIYLDAMENRSEQEMLLPAGGKYVRVGETLLPADPSSYSGHTERIVPRIRYLGPDYDPEKEPVRVTDEGDVVHTSSEWETKAWPGYTSSSQMPDYKKLLSKKDYKSMEAWQKKADAAAKKTTKLHPSTEPIKPATFSQPYNEPSRYTWEDGDLKDTGQRIDIPDTEPVRYVPPVRKPK